MAYRERPGWSFPTHEEMRERAWTKAAERYVVLPGIPVSPEEVGGLLADAFQPVFPWEKGAERRKTLDSRGHARRRLRELIESRLPISLP